MPHAKPGDRVLAWLPVVTSPFQDKFSGPYRVVRCLTYVLDTSSKKVQVCHLNSLKPYFTPETFVGLVAGSSANYELLCSGVCLLMSHVMASVMVMMELLLRDG